MSHLFKFKKDLEAMLNCIRIEKLFLFNKLFEKVQFIDI